VQRVQVPDWSVTACRFAPRCTPQDEKLVAKKHNLGFATGMRSEQSDEPSTEQFEDVDHPGETTASLRLCQPG
jgi:hypothetical protein